ncbi:MAG: CIA30 family protein [Flavobacteriales bacterium]|nr:CIA30 family protein [Flavobacteriales bacterium]
MNVFLSFAQTTLSGHIHLGGILGFILVLMSCAKSAPPASHVSSEGIRFSFDMADPWRPLNDGVMGGLSEGEVEVRDSSITWHGQTRLENNGGFASLRSTWSARDLSDLDRIVVTCRGTGGPFKLTMETSGRWWMPYAYASFAPTAEWHEVVIPASDLKWSQAQMGDLTSVRPSRDLNEVLRLGLMKYDGTAQAFDLEVASIAFLTR